MMKIRLDSRNIFYQSDEPTVKPTKHPEAHQIVRYESNYESLNYCVFCKDFVRYSSNTCYTITSIFCQVDFRMNVNDIPEHARQLAIYHNIPLQ